MNQFRCILADDYDEGSSSRAASADNISDDDSELNSLLRIHHIESHREGDNEEGFLSLTPQNSISEEDIHRYQEQCRSIRRKRLIVRPAVIFLLGFFVFRNTNNSGIFSRFRLGSRSGSRLQNPSDAKYSTKNVVGMESSASANTIETTQQQHSSMSEDYIYSENKNDMFSARTSWLSNLGGNPIASAYNVVTDLNDDDANDDLPASVVRFQTSSPTTTSNNNNNNIKRETKQSLFASINNSNDDEDEEDSASSYGWVPDMFPDPWIDPVRCGIAYLTGLPSTEGVNAEEERRGGFVVEDPNNTEAAVTDTQEDHLRLCDPDWVFGGRNLESIAEKMKAFSQKFTTGDLGQILAEDVLTTHQRQRAESQESLTLAVAAVRKMNVHEVLREDNIAYSYGYDEDMVNDAAEIFAKSLHNQWWESRYYSNGVTNTNDNDPSGVRRHLTEQEAFLQTDAEWFGYNQNTHRKRRKDFGVLIFLSIQDRVCFISTGSAVSTVLPWWRLDRIVNSMKPSLRHRDYGGSILTAIDHLSEMLEAGPPTVEDRMTDFLARFGVVIAFALFTFLFGAYGECRDRRRRWRYAESRSKLNEVDREKARLKQKEFNAKHCPICLESFFGDDDEEEENNINADKDCCCEDSRMKKPCAKASKKKKLVKLDSYGIPVNGADNKAIKLLRCGHVFCDSCWRNWVHMGQGNPCICPVCRQDIGKSSSKRKRRKEQRRAARRALQTEPHAAAVISSTRSDQDVTARRSMATESTSALLPQERVSTTPAESSLDTRQGFGSYAFPTYGAVSTLPDVDARLSSSNTVDPMASDSSRGGSSSSSEGQSREQDGMFLVDMGVNLWASAFGPNRSRRSMNHDRSRRRYNPDFARSQSESFDDELSSSSWVD